MGNQPDKVIEDMRRDTSKLNLIGMHDLHGGLPLVLDVLAGDGSGSSSSQNTTPEYLKPDPPQKENKPTSYNNCVGPCGYGC